MTDSTLFSKAGAPEDVGIPSRAILQFLERIERKRICMHGFLLLRCGRIAAEGYWEPFASESMHRMYSVSKSFVSLAIGLMIDEGTIRLDDAIVDYFPDLLPDRLHPYLAQSTIRDLLMMATPHDRTTYTAGDDDWARTFFHTTPSHPPGTIFAYDTSATVVLNTIVERLSGVPFLEYMRPRLLDPVGFSEDAWCIRTPEGTSWGGSGVICRLRDMAKLAYVCMHGGRWGDKQLIAESYITDATSKQIDNSLNGHPGYGYQIWRLEENGFAFRGMGGQFAFCFPDRDFLFACIADMQGDDSGRAHMIDAFWHVYSRLEDGKLPADPGTSSQLLETIENLKVLPQPGRSRVPIEEEIDGVWFTCHENPMGIQRMRLVFHGDQGAWEYTNDQGDNCLRFGIGKMVSGKFPQRNYFGDQIGARPGVRYDCLASAGWVEEHKLNLLVYITDNHLGNLKITFAFKGDQISIYMTKAAEWFLGEYQGFAGGAVADSC